MIKLIYKRKNLDYPEVEFIPDELPYGLALQLALASARIKMFTCDYAHIVNT